MANVLHVFPTRQQARTWFERVAVAEGWRFNERLYTVLDAEDNCHFGFVAVPSTSLAPIRSFRLAVIEYTDDVDPAVEQSMRTMFPNAEHRRVVT